jgi:organic radical activating enzyme
MYFKNDGDHPIKAPFACPFPWTSLSLNYDGGISFCCLHYPFAHISELSEKSVDSIWNGRVAQDLRRRWKEGRLKGTPCGSCPGLSEFKRYAYPVNDLANMPEGSYKDNVKLNISEINNGDTILRSMPVSIYYTPSVLCNIDCIHCCQPEIGKNNHTYIDTKEILRFYNILGGLAVSNAISGGEPMYLKQTFRLIDEFSREQKAASELILFTNALLIKEKFQQITGFRKYDFEISIVSSRKETYERIHSGADFDKLIENLEFLVKCKAEGIDISVNRIMVLMKSNFDDLDNVFKFASTYKLDNTWIRAIDAAYHKYKMMPDENIFMLPYLLNGIPHWRDTLEKTSQAALSTNNHVAFNHLQYLQRNLSGNRLVNYYRSMLNWVRWFFTISILRIWREPVQRAKISSLKYRLANYFDKR